MDFLSMLGLNPNDVLDFFKVLERGVIALERMADALGSMDEHYLSVRDFDKNP